ncbi:hypothetical protein J4208_03885 [Candidatus Woesearchaeota archaeon]|nr:hypothetical protein [Candidatus Woesearchaeota archaeon]
MKQKNKKRQMMLLAAGVILLIGTYIVAMNAVPTSAEMTGLGNGEKMGNIQRMMESMDEEMYEECNKMMGTGMIGEDHAQHHAR